jgi:uncharacterized RDD family membrane protein YckC
MGTSAPEQLSSREFCSECGRPYSQEDLARFGNVAVCAECKPNYVQRMREGLAAPTTGVQYGGFWRRFAAVLVDGILISIFALPIKMALAVFGVNSAFGPDRAGLVAAFFGLSALINSGLFLLYYTYFLSQKGATLGKMLLGLKVVTSAGGPISVGRAIGRYFAQNLSFLILGIGYLMAAFDDQKRALHDYICDTRVIRD